MTPKPATPSPTRASGGESRDVRRERRARAASRIGGEVRVWRCSLSTGDFARLVHILAIDVLPRLSKVFERRRRGDRGAGRATRD